VNWKFVEIGDPQRGDVIVFRKPSEPSVTFIKRLVGLPGDRITVTEQGVLVNGQPAAVTLGDFYQGPKEAQYPFTTVATERLGERSHRIMLDPARPVATGEWVVPQGQYFFMGDNRNNSRDSRFLEVGFVPDRNIVGRAVVIWLSFNPDRGSLLLWGRMATRIQ
jgi:signal peptidase I